MHQTTEATLNEMKRSRLRTDLLRIEMGSGEEVQLEVLEVIQRMQHGYEPGELQEFPALSVFQKRRLFD